MRPHITDQSAVATPEIEPLRLRRQRTEMNHQSLNSPPLILANGRLRVL
jgi:hypothetical protein